MSRYSKAAPGGRSIVLDDGYHLCARCGTVLCTDDRVVVVYRAPSWGIYTHLLGPDCPAKAVSGWRAVELALDMRESNIPTPREAYPVSFGGFSLPFVSLLDDEHCSAEKHVVTVTREEFLPSKEQFLLSEKDFLRWDEDFLPSEAGRSEWDNGKSVCDRVGTRGRRRDWRRWQYWEYWEVGIVAIASELRRLAEMARNLLRQERARLYVKCSGPWSAVGGFSSVAPLSAMSRAQQRKSRRPDAPEKIR